MHSRAYVPKNVPRLKILRAAPTLASPRIRRFGDTLHRTWQIKSECGAVYVVGAGITRHRRVTCVSALALQIARRLGFSRNYARRLRMRYRHVDDRRHYDLRPRLDLRPPASAQSLLIAAVPRSRTVGLHASSTGYVVISIQHFLGRPGFDLSHQQSLVWAERAVAAREGQPRC